MEGGNTTNTKIIGWCNFCLCYWHRLKHIFGYILFFCCNFASDIWLNKFFWMHYSDIAESCDWYSIMLWFSILIYSNSGRACWHMNIIWAFFFLFFLINIEFPISNVVPKTNSWIIWLKDMSQFSCNLNYPIHWQRDS